MTWLNALGPRIGTALDVVAGRIMLLICFGGFVYALEKMRGTWWFGVWVFAVFLSPFWLFVRIEDAWKTKEKKKQEKREAEERQKRISQEQTGKN